MRLFAGLFALLLKFLPERFRLRRHLSDGSIDVNLFKRVQQERCRFMFRNRRGCQKHNSIGVKLDAQVNFIVKLRVNRLTVVGNDAVGMGKLFRKPAGHAVVCT